MLRQEPLLAVGRDFFEQVSNLAAFENFIATQGTGVNDDRTVGTEEGAVALLDDHSLRGLALEFRQQLTSVCSRDGDAQVLPPHPEEGGAHVRGRLLADPKDRLLGLSEGRGEPVHRCHQLTPLSRQAGMLAEIVVQQVDDEQQVLRACIAVLDSAERHCTAAGPARWTSYLERS